MRRTSLRSTFGIAVALSLAVSFGLASRANAGIIVTLQTASTTYTVFDNGPGDSDPADTGNVIISTVFPEFSTDIDIGVSNSPGSTVHGELKIESIIISAPVGGGGSLKITISDTDFTLPGNPGDTLALESSGSGTFTNGAIGDYVKFQSFADPNNGQPADAVFTAQTVGLRTNLALSTESFSLPTVVTSFARGAGPYSLASVTDIFLSPGATFDSNQFGGSTVTSLLGQAPEPSTVALLGVAFPLLLCRRKV